MKKIGFLIIVSVCIACSSTKKIRINDMRISDGTSRYDNVRFKVYKDTATWIDGKTYLFVKGQIENFYHTLRSDRSPIHETESISVRIETDSTHVFPLLMRYREALFLTDDFEKYGQSSCMISFSWQEYYTGSQPRNDLYSDFFSKTVEVDFNELRKENLFSVYPEADKEWYKKWKDNNPDYKDRRMDAEKMLEIIKRNQSE